MLVLLFLVLWYLYSLTVPAFVLPNPINVLRIAFSLFFDPGLASNTLVSFLRVLISLSLALVVGTVLVLFGNYVPVFNQFVGGRLMPFLNSFPSFGWAMIAVIWLGVGDVSVIFVETTILLPFCMINIWEGIKVLDNEILEMTNSFTHSRMKALRLIVLPMLFPFMFAAVRVSYGVGWKVSLIAELFGSSSGIGYFMNISRGKFDVASVFASIVVIVIMVYVVDAFGFSAIDRRLSRWRSSASAPIMQY